VNLLDGRPVLSVARAGPSGPVPPWMVGGVALCIALNVLTAGTAAVLRGAEPAFGLVVDDVRADADWILSAQFADGAIANYVDRQAVWPYLSNFAAMGLVRAREVTGNKKYSDAAWRWLNWYQSKQDATGFVTDYVVRNGVLTSTGDMDSTDSYAATFLLAVREAYRVTADKSMLNGLKPGMAKAVGAIEATLQPDGLTWAKPAWKVKYLMDQAEAYAGLVAAGELAKVVNDGPLGTRARNDAAKMRSGVDKLWNPATNAYDWAVHESGARTPSNASILYSDALQQVWAVTFGVVDQPRAGDLMARFNRAQPNWSSPTATASFSGGTQTVGYWPQAAFGYAELASPVAAPALAGIRRASVTANRAWPYTTGTAGQVIYTEAYSPLTSLLTTIVTLSPLVAPTTTAKPKAATQAAPATTATSPTTKAPSPSAATKASAPVSTTTTAPPLVGVSVATGSLAVNGTVDGAGARGTVSAGSLPPVGVNLPTGAGR
jgi:hypothetical protein